MVSQLNWSLDAQEPCLLCVEEAVAETIAQNVRREFWAEVRFVNDVFRKTRQEMLRHPLIFSAVFLHWLLFRGTTRRFELIGQTLVLTSMKSEIELAKEQKGQ